MLEVDLVIVLEYRGNDLWLVDVIVIDVVIGCKIVIEMEIFNVKNKFNGDVRKRILLKYL